MPLLSRIASYLGKPVCTDSLIAEEGWILYARMLIEMDVSQPLPEHMFIEEPNGNTRKQELDYDWWPEYCQECMILTDETQYCPKKKPQPEPPKQVPVLLQD